MKSRMLSILVPAVFLLALSLLSQDAGAADFTTENIGSSTINASETGHSITIYVTDNDPSLSITNVSMILYSFTFVSGTNSTNASNTNFINSTAETSLGWGNLTDTPLIASGGGTTSFTFSVNAPLANGSYNINVSAIDSAGVQTSSNITYSVVDNPIYQIAFSSPLTSQSTNLIENLSYSVTITNTGSLRKTYNLYVVNCTDNQVIYVGILNLSSVTLNASEAKAVQINVSNSTSGLYSSCIMAKHYNGSMEDSSNVTSSGSVVLNSGFYPDIDVTNIYWTSSGGESPYPGGNITMNVTLNNTGHFNFQTPESIAVYLLWDGAVVNNTVLILNTSLLNGTPYSYTGFPNITGITAGLHNLTVWADPSNSLAESSESNNNLTEQVLVGYNVAVLSVTAQSVLNASVGGVVNISVSVTYPNGSVVTGLEKANFSVLDVQNGTTYTSSNEVFSSSFTNGTDGVYWFNITSHSSANNTDTLPGVHNLTVTASRNEGDRNYSGSNAAGPYYYLLVPRLVVTVTASVNYMSEGGTTKTVYINVTNTGTYPIYNVTLGAASSNTDYMTLGSLSGLTMTQGNNALLEAGSSSSYFFYCTVVATSQTVSEDSPASVTVTAMGNYNYSTNVTYVKSGSFTFTIENVDDSGDTGDTGGTTGTLGKSCTTDNQCGTNESCVSNKCAAISCPNGEIIDHFCMTVTYKINITSFESALSADSGGSNSTKVTVKNTGADKFTAKLEVTINNVTATVSPASYVLDAGESYQFTVDFTVPNTTTVGEFSGTFKAFVSTSTSSYQSKSFKFKVFPNTETKSLINLSYEELESLLAAAMANLSRMKASGMYNQSVISAIENLISAANSTLLQMKSAMDSDDYVTAQSLISQVNTSISSANAQMGGAQVESSGFSPLQYGIWFWVAVAVIIIFVVGFFVYMFYPSGHVGFHPEKGYAHPAAREGVGARIKKLFKRKKGLSSGTSTKSIAQSVAEPSKESHYETFHYGQDYSKEKSYSYEYSKGAEAGGGFLQRFRKKKKAVTPQMHLDQFSGQPVAEQKNEEVPKS
jgi:hypothetical protein